MYRIKFIRYGGAVFAIFFTFFLLPEAFKQKYIAENGREIVAQVVELPECCECKNNYAEFVYQKKTFNDKVWPGFCPQYKLGDNIVFYYHEKFPDTYVFSTFKSSYLDLEIASTLLLSLLGIICFIYSFKKVV